MKKTQLVITTIALILTAGLTNAAPHPNYTGQGYVTIEPHPGYPTGFTAMTGSMNVQIRPYAGHENSRLRTSTDSGGGVYFYGYDAVNDKQFVCTVPASAKIYDYARHIQSAAVNGTRLFVTKRDLDNQCVAVILHNDSLFIN